MRLEYVLEFLKWSETLFSSTSVAKPGQRESHEKPKSFLGYMYVSSSVTLFSALIMDKAGERL